MKPTRGNHLASRRWCLCVGKMNYQQGLAMSTLLTQRSLAICSIGSPMDQLEGDLVRRILQLFSKKTYAGSESKSRDVPSVLRIVCR